jgi:hypothetical protein
MSVRLFACISTSLTGQVTVKLYIGAYENISKDLNLFKIGQKYGALYTKTKYVSLLSTTLISIKSLFAM